MRGPPGCQHACSQLRPPLLLAPAAGTPARRGQHRRSGAAEGASRQRRQNLRRRARARVQWQGRRRCRRRRSQHRMQPPPQPPRACAGPRQARAAPRAQRELLPLARRLARQPRRLHSRLHLKENSPKVVAAEKGQHCTHATRAETSSALTSTGSGVTVLSSSRWVCRFAAALTTASTCATDGECFAPMSSA
jgi:hypothetical protein